MILGAGAAGFAIARFLNELGVGDVVVCDRGGAIYTGRPEHMNPWKDDLAARTNRAGEQGQLEEVIRGKTLFVGVARPNMVTRAMVESMEKDPIIFALANPISEISVEDALAGGAAVAMDGRGMNNALAYPGIFRGALDARAARITTAMKLAAARTLADAASDQLLPNMLDRPHRTSRCSRRRGRCLEERLTPGRRPLRSDQDSPPGGAADQIGRGARHSECAAGGRYGALRIAARPQ